MLQVSLTSWGLHCIFSSLSANLYVTLWEAAHGYSYPATHGVTSQAFLWSLGWSLCDFTTHAFCILAKPASCGQCQSLANLSDKWAFLDPGCRWSLSAWWLSLVKWIMGNNFMGGLVQPGCPSGEPFKWVHSFIPLSLWWVGSGQFLTWL
jgi:hypothetical protein